jgi:hypothetical protein
MEEENRTQVMFIIEDGVEVPESALHCAKDEPYYGSVPGLSDDELASVAELERQVFIAEWGPLLALPFKAHDGIRPTIDEFGRVDWGAFGTWDFERLRGPFDKGRYKADKLREKLRNELFMLDMVRERLSPNARARLRRLALDDRCDLDDIADPDERSYARWIRRVRELSEEIRELCKCSWQGRWRLESLKANHHNGGRDSEVEQ